MTPEYGPLSPQLGCADAAKILQLVDEMVTGPGHDGEVRENLIAIEAWCRYLGDMLRDAGRVAAAAAIVANQTTEEA